VLEWLEWLNLLASQAALQQAGLDLFAGLESLAQRARCPCRSTSGAARRWRKP